MVVATSRLLLIAQPQPAVRSAMINAVATSGLDELLKDVLFAPGNWHQSLSGRYPDTSHFRQTLLGAGNRISASAFSMFFNRITSEGNRVGAIQYGFRGMGNPKGLQDLLLAVRHSLLEEGIEESMGHRPHATISYFAHARAEPCAIEPIEWKVDEVRLVQGGGQPYHYRVLAHWNLLPPQVQSSSQLELKL